MVKLEEKVINNKRVLDLLFIDEWSSFNLLLFVDASELGQKSLIAGESYVVTVVNSIDTDRRMRLRLKSIREINSFIGFSSNKLKIYLKNINDIDKLKSKLDLVKDGKNKVILVYKGYEVDTGIKVDNKDVSYNDLNQLDGVVAK